MLEALKRYAEMAIAVTAIVALLDGAVVLVGGHLPPWETFADAQDVKDRLNKNDVVQASIQLELLNSSLDNAWKEYKQNHDDNAKNDIRRITREIRKLDPTEELPTPPEP